MRSWSVSLRSPNWRFPGWNRTAVLSQRCWEQGCGAFPWMLGGFNTKQKDGTCNLLGGFLAVFVDVSPWNIIKRKPAFFPYFVHHDSTRVSPWNGRNAPLWRVFVSTGQPVETRRRVNGENNTNQVWMRRYSKVSEKGTAQKSRAMKIGPLVV